MGLDVEHRPGTTLAYTKGKTISQIDHGVQGPQNCIDHGMVQWVLCLERPKMCSGGKNGRKCCYNKILMNNFFGEEKMKTRE